MNSKEDQPKLHLNFFKWCFPRAGKMDDTPMELSATQNDCKMSCSSVEENSG